MQIDQERLNAFQARMSSWVAGQGLFFQLRYAAAVRGTESSLFAAVMRLVLRLVIVVLVVLVGLWVFLAKRVDYGWFRNDLGEKISVALGANSAVVGSVSRERGHVNLQRVSLEGGEGSFFYDADIRGLRTRMGLLDGVVKDWNGESVTMKTLTISLKGGAETDEEAQASYKSLFFKPSQFSFDVVDVEDATLSWGYSEIHRGSIQGAHLKANRREDGGWKVVIKGGLFSQNWIRRFEIERMEVIVTQDRFEIVEMKLAKDGGSLELAGTLNKGGARPEFEGSGSMRSLSIWSVVEADYREFVDGVISGTLKFSGSTNTQAGFQVEAEVDLEEGDHVVLRDRFPLFRAISAVDRFRSYKKVRFSTGGFQMKTGGDQLELSKILLQALDLMRMEGDVTVRLPTDEEVKERLKMEERPTVGAAGRSSATDGGREKKDEEKELSLRDAGEARKKAQERKDQSIRSLILGSQTNSTEVREIVEKAAKREKEAYFLEGEVRIGITKDVFDRAPALDETYPVDDETGLRWLALPLNGSIFMVGKDLADQIYLQSRGAR